MTAPTFDFNPGDVSVGIPVYDKGSYELEIGEPKSFYAQGKNGKADNHGVRFVCKIADGPQKGKKYIVNCYMHTPESQSFSKAFLMAALGFDPKKDGNEAKFNEKYQNENWRYDPNTKTAGDMWHKVTNQRVIVDLDTEIDKESDAKKQVLKGYRPIASA